MQEKKIYLGPTYSLGEELINSISHGVASLLAITAMVLCIVKATYATEIVSVVIYGVLMILLYVISCVYHALSPKLKGKHVLRVIDHCNVMLMEAGTYTPICLSLLSGKLGWVLFAVVWTVTIIAVVFNAINVNKFQVLSVICNLVLGWGILVIIKPLMAVCPTKGIILLALGGLMYTIGAILYGIGSRVPYMHSVFHFFVIAGSILHFFFIYIYCI